MYDVCDSKIKKVFLNYEHEWYKMRIITYFNVSTVLIFSKSYIRGNSNISRNALSISTNAL